jgi:hypothetical protein
LIPPVLGNKDGCGHEGRADTPDTTPQTRISLKSDNLRVAGDALIGRLADIHDAKETATRPEGERYLAGGITEEVTAANNLPTSPFVERRGVEVIALKMFRSDSEADAVWGKDHETLVESARRGSGSL